MEILLTENIEREINHLLICKHFVERDEAEVVHAGSISTRKEAIKPLEDSIDIAIQAAQRVVAEFEAMKSYYC